VQFNRYPASSITWCCSHCFKLHELVPSHVNTDLPTQQRAVYCGCQPPTKPTLPIAGNSLNSSSRAQHQTFYCRKLHLRAVKLRSAFKPHQRRDNLHAVFALRSPRFAPYHRTLISVLTPQPTEGSYALRTSNCASTERACEIPPKNQ